MGPRYLIPPNFSETVAASVPENAGLQRGGPWGPPEHIPARTAAPPLRVGSRPGAAATGETGPEEAGAPDVAGSEQRTHLSPGELTRAHSVQARARVALLGDAHACQGAPQDVRIRFPPKLVRSSPSPFPELEEGVYFVSFFKPLHHPGGGEVPSLGPRRLYTPLGPARA